MDAVTASEFAALVRGGLLAADKTYRDWTGGWGLADNGVEGFVTTWIANHIVEEVRRRQGPQGAYVALELRLNDLLYDLSPSDRRDHFEQLLAEARASDHDIADSLKEQARLDLVFYDGQWPEDTDKLRPRGIIEVKRWFDKNTYPKDMRRIANLLNAFGPANGGSLLYGCFVFFKFERDGAREPLSAAIEKIEAMQTKFLEYGCACRVESTPLPTADGTPAKAAAVSVVFEVQT